MQFNTAPPGKKDVHILQFIKILNNNIGPGILIWDPDVKTGFAGNGAKWT